MRIAALIANNNVFPVAPKSDYGFGYGGYSRFYEGLAYGIKEIDKDITLFIVGPFETNPGEFAKNVVKLKSRVRGNRGCYLDEAVRTIRKLNPDFVIIQNPALVRREITNDFNHVCRVAGYLYQNFILDKVNYVVNSDWGNIHYKKSWPVVYQTCCPTDVEYCEDKEDYWLFVSNLSRGFKEKGLEFACRFARSNNMNLVVAGPVGENSDSLRKIRSFECENVKYVGPIVGNNKKNLIKKAKAVFYPIDKKCKEMGSTFVTEAAFCGTPFVTTNVGCMPEYVKHGVSGFVCNSNSDFEKACNKIESINPKECLQWANEKFNHVKIANGYLDIMG